jgi:minor curlin subunit
VKRIHLAMLAALIAMGAGGAHAQGRFDRYGYHPPKLPKIAIIQNGQNNGAAVSQNGKVNAAGINQNGANNTGMINQTGSGNDASIRQLGRGNDASISQTGDNNAACVVQIGKNLSSDVVQTGGQNHGVIQTKKGSYNIPAQLCSLDPGSKGYWQRLGFKGY